MYFLRQDHYLGQPAAGNKDVVYSITPEQVKKFHHDCYVGKNIVISGAGAIDAVALTTEAGIHFGNVEAFNTSEVTNSDQSFFTPSLLFQRDDEMLNTCFSVAFEAPSWNDPDFFGMNYFKRIIGDYQINKFNGEHLNSPHLQYNTFHTWIGGYPDIIMHKPFYFAYSDTALFGNFIYGNEMFTLEMSTVPQNQMSIYAQYVPFALARSTSLRSSEPETNTSTICSTRPTQLRLPPRTAGKLPTWTE